MSKENELINKLLGTIRPLKAVEVYHDLFQGSQVYEKEDYEKLKDLKIKTVIDLEGDFVQDMNYLETYMQWPIRDVPWLPDKEVLFAVGVYGARVVNAKKRVFVHSRQGLNRAGLVCAQVMSILGMGGKEILNAIIGKVPSGLWNPVFRKYVKDL